MVVTMVVPTPGSGHRSTLVTPSLIQQLTWNHTVALLATGPGIYTTTCYSTGAALVLPAECSVEPDIWCPGPRSGSPCSWSGDWGSTLLERNDGVLPIAPSWLL